MIIQAISKYERISAKKIRDLARELRGLDANRALEHLLLLPLKGARIIAKSLKSAIANAENNHNTPGNTLQIEGVYVDQGITFRRHRPASRGSAHPYRKKTSHITVKLKEKGSN